MAITISNIKELVFYRPHLNRSDMPEAVDKTEQVKITRFLVYYSLPASLSLSVYKECTTN